MARSKYVIAVDIGGTNTKLGMVNTNGRILRTTSFSTCRQRGDVIDRVIKEAYALVNSTHIRRKDILGIGMGVAGPTDHSRGLIHHFVNVPGWRNTPLARIVRSRTKLPTFIDNDVNVMTIGELYFGAGRGAKNMICLTLGTGVGGGVVIDEKLHRGSNLVAGEIGHMPINVVGRKCNCGGIGCMEMYVGNKYIVENALRRLKGKKSSLILKLIGNDRRKLTPKVLAIAAQRGDKTANAVWADTGLHLGVAIAASVSLINPERIVIGGGVAGAGEVLFKHIRKAVRDRTMKEHRHGLRIVRAKLGGKAGLVGAMQLVRLSLDK